MRSLFLAATAAILAASSAQASVLVLGNSLAGSCYRAAEARDADARNLRDCDDAFTQAMTDGDRVATHVNRGILRLIREDFAGADADFTAAMALNPAEPEAWLNRGILRIKQGRSGEALQPIDRSLQLRTRRPAIAYYARGLAHEDVGDVRSAYQDLKQALALAPQSREISTELARYQVRTR